LLAFPRAARPPLERSRIRIPLPRTLTTLAAAALLWGAALAPARAQTTSPRTMPPAAPAPPPPAAPIPLPGADTVKEESTQGSGTIAGGPLVDAPVSRSAYRLGPGDVLSVAVFGEFSHVYTVPVTPEGTVVIPRWGSRGCWG